MPIRPKSHAERQRPQTLPLARRAYDMNRRKTDAALARAKQIRNSARWRRVRAMQLTRAPLCANPYGYHQHSVTATQVDHIVPLAVQPLLAFDLDNLQSLCTACHARKSTDERRMPAAGIRG